MDASSDGDNAALRLYVCRISGVGVAFVASLSFKTKFFRHHHMPLESCMVVIFAFGSYMLADSFGLSGIVAILFCGLVWALTPHPAGQCVPAPCCNPP